MGGRRPYDAFQISERDTEDDGDVFREILKVLRLVLYFVITLTVLAGTVVSRLSLLLLTSGISQVRQHWIHSHLGTSSRGSSVTWVRHHWNHQLLRYVITGIISRLGTSVRGSLVA